MLCTAVSNDLNEPNTSSGGEATSRVSKSVEEVLAEQNDKIATLQNSISMLLGQGSTNSDEEFNPFMFVESEMQTSNTDEIDEILRNNDIDGQDKEEIDPAVLNLLDELSQPNEYGPQVEKITAQAFQAIPTYQITKEAYEKWKAEYKTPENCQNLLVPMVNSEIWNSLPMSAKSSDAKYQAMQQTLMRSMIAQTRAMDVIIKSTPRSTLPSILKPLLDSAKQTSIVIQDINLRRKNNLKTFMRPEYRLLCSSKLPTTKFLFGDNLEQSMKAVRATSSIIRPLNESYRRFHPYRQLKPNHLNYNRPLQQQPFNRGGLQFRNPRRNSQRGRWNNKFRH